MASCNDLFKEFHGSIVLSSSKKDSLRTSRDQLRKDIKGYFKDVLKVNVPKNWGQGSYSMGTLINPANGGEYDIDDGVYLQNLGSDPSKWKTPDTVHGWVYDAVKNRTKATPTDKRTCIRVQYSEGYHVDLPIYAEAKGQWYLAEKGTAGWHPSDPKKLTDWFKQRIKDTDELLRRVVCYMKAWADVTSSKKGKLPSGLVLTVLCADSYHQWTDDDASVGGTLTGIRNNMLSQRMVVNPVDPSENLYDRVTDEQHSRFQDCLKELHNDAQQALQTKSKKEACKLWKKHFGDRFPCCDSIEDNEIAIRTSAPALLRNDARSA